MNPLKITVIPIHPSTHVRSTQGDRWLFKVSDEYLANYDQKRLKEKGKVGRNLLRKRQLEKYNAYKEELRWWVKQKGFRMPTGYFAIWFCIPHPKSWRKKKIQENLYKEHQDTPDFDNLLKSFFDSVMPRKSKTSGEKGCDDRRIHCCATFKIWVKEDEACIKIVEYDKWEFISQFHTADTPNNQYCNQ